MKHFTEQEIDAAVVLLKKGGVLVFPTETSYGLGCDATHAQAVERIFMIKGRPKEKGLPVLVDTMHNAEAHVYLGARGQKLGARHWPGALNVVAPRTEVSTIVAACSQDGAQSVRISSHPVARALVEGLGAPMVATSANPSGDEALYDLATIDEAFRNQPDQPDACVDVGPLVRTPASTTVLVQNEEVTVLRQGDIQIEK